MFGFIDRIKVFIISFITLLGGGLTIYLKYLQNKNERLEKEKEVAEDNAKVAEKQINDIKEKEKFEEKLDNKVDEINKENETKKESIIDKIDNEKDGVRYEVKI